jgi:hypothetical protein
MVLLLSKLDFMGILLGIVDEIGSLGLVAAGAGGARVPVCP